MKNSKIYTYLILVIGIVLVTMMCIKAGMSSFTHDESFSYLEYIKDSFMDILSYRNSYTNNHVLNSLGMKYSEIVFGSSELALRLPNLMAMLIYLVFGYKILKNSVSNTFLITGFILLAFNGSVTDLFGVARGYGLSFGFMMMAIYYLLIYVENFKLKHIYGFHVAMVLAVLSNFNMLTVYITLIGVLGVFFIVKSILDNQGWLKALSYNSVHVIPVIIAVAVLFEPVRRVLTYSELDFGGKNGFVEDTIVQIVINFTQGIPMNSLFFNSIVGIVILSVLGASAFIVVKLKKEKLVFLESFKGLVLLNLTLLIITLVIIFTHVIIGTDYPVARFSLYLLPLFLTHLVLFLSAIHEYYFAALSKGLLIFLSIGSIIMFSLNFRWYTYSEWEYDQNTKQAMHLLKVYHEKNHPSEKEVRMHVSWFFTPSTNFYRETLNMEWLQTMDRENLSNSYSYVYTFQEELDTMEYQNFEVITQFENTQTVLARVHPK